LEGDAAASLVSKTTEWDWARGTAGAGRQVAFRRD
jgi:hypothetical protein